jgi:hypothetical protein
MHGKAVDVWELDGLLSHINRDVSELQQLIPAITKENRKQK